MTCSKKICNCKEEPKSRCIWWDEPESESLLVNAWIAGYYHAGYTNDRAYAEKMAREYVSTIKEQP